MHLAVIKIAWKSFWSLCVRFPKIPKNVSSRVKKTLRNEKYMKVKTSSEVEPNQCKRGNTRQYDGISEIRISEIPLISFTGLC